MSTMTPLERKQFHIDGVVQGVGFRPFVYGLAVRCALTGWVLNSSSGVDIEVQGDTPALQAFQAAITAEAPPLARVLQVSAATRPVIPEELSFVIRDSQADAGVSLVPPDVATCPECVAEIFDPANRRYRYPFTNCTNCGPRYTIIEGMPYDRRVTSMRLFEMCPQCRAEYQDPLNRRYHAQPNACPTCGPQVKLSANPKILAGLMSDLADDIARAAALLRQGCIVAIKGIGGFHIACDATDAAAVARLRQRKFRPDKPLAVMMASLEEIQRQCEVSEDEARLLSSASAPIVLIYRKMHSDVAENVAPRNPMLGAMLPYTPLHHLLLHDAGRPLVMTSGNLSDLPVIKDDDEAQQRLAGIADAFLLHDRPIHMRCDDAVWWVDRFAEERDAAFQPLRRSRGDAPYPVRLPWRSERHILATGGEMKNTLCLLRDDQAFLSQHIGEVDSLESLDYFRAALDHLCRLFKVEPQVIVHDLHPGYLTTRLAGELAAERGLALLAAQHHHAHIAACLAENEHPGPAIGIALDGTGYGPDGAIWGGEALVADLKAYRRALHLEYLPLPGGDTAIRRPYRIAWGYLHSVLGSIPDLPGLTSAPPDERNVVIRQVMRGLNVPMTSSMGRLFDAVAAMLGICTIATFEAQAAIALELAAREVDIAREASYPFFIEDYGPVRVGALLRGIVEDIQGGRPAPEIAMRFHVTVARMAAGMAERLRSDSGLTVVALSGGAFQNRLLLRLTREMLRESGFDVLTHRRVPANDGGLSLGQAAIALSSG